jgi:hypothetical protein
MMFTPARAERGGVALHLHGPHQRVDDVNARPVRVCPGTDTAWHQTARDRSVRLPPRCLCRCDARRPALAAAKVKSSSKGRHGTAQRQLSGPAVAQRSGTHARARAARRSTSRWRGAEASCRKCSALARPLRLSPSVPVGCARPHYCTHAHKHTRTRTPRRPFTIGGGGTIAHSHLARDAVSCNVVL